MTTDALQPRHVMPKRLSGLILMLAAVLIAPAALCSNGPCLTLKAVVTVDRDAVHLSDIASLTGGSPKAREVMGATVVASAPPPGKTRFVGVDYIRIRLKQAGIDTASITVKGPKDVRIVRRAATLPAGRIRRAVEAAIRGKMQWKQEDVTISDITFDETIQLPSGKLTYRIEPKRKEDFLGRTIVALHLFVDGQPVRKVWVNATISVMANVVTVVRPLGKHQYVELADLSMERRNLANLSADTVCRMDEVLGNRTTRMIYPGTVLKASMIASPPVVKRGDIVRIVANAGTMTITATGMVKQQGRKGDTVRVMNTDSNRIITARVTGPGAVVVDF